ncbi:MAG TPA: nucleotidyltransferase [Ruminiclostridium sp.]|nr:nucleotidyltransferase [Ruminiclostridium sp.]
MKVLGIVAEYNPFHNGHMYHIEESRKAAGCDAVICVMSGNFIQRGEPAVINKFARTETAIENGVDLVIELPVPFAMSSAESFAYGAVKILDSIGLVDCISFGSESGDIHSLQTIAKILADEPEAYREELKSQLDDGLSFPVCRQKALENYLKLNPHGIAGENLSLLLETSNNILALEYLKALIRLKSNIRPFTVQRVSNSYNTNQLTGSISSATAIRNRIYGSDKTRASMEIDGTASQALPAFSRQILQKEICEGRGPNSLYSLENIILALLRHTTLEQIGRLPDVSEGLEYRIKKAVINSGSVDELLSNICTKRYPKTRIQRIILSMLTGMTKDDMEQFMELGGPQYARILGFNSTGRELLSMMKKNSEIPVITKASGYKNSSNKLIKRMLEIEAQATDTYVLAYKNPAFRKAGQDFTQNIIICR